MIDWKDSYQLQAEREFTRNAKVIFTYDEKPDLQTRAAANEKIRQMFLEIQEKYGNYELPFTIMVGMVHKHGCDHCERSLPVFERICQNLQLIFKRFDYFILEYNQMLNSSQNIATGEDLYLYFNQHEKYNVTGVPFFLLNFTISTKRINRNDVLSIRKKAWYPISSGELQPLAFLSAAFKINNPFLT